MNPFITVKPMGRWSELTIHWETVDGPDSSSVYLPAEDAWEIQRKVNEQEPVVGTILPFPTDRDELKKALADATEWIENIRSRSDTSFSESEINAPSVLGRISYYRNLYDD